MFYLVLVLIDASMRNHLELLVNGERCAAVTDANTAILALPHPVICCTRQSAVLLAEVVVNSGL
jgi:hypothetical protein